MKRLKLLILHLSFSFLSPLAIYAGSEIDSLKTLVNSSPSDSIKQAALYELAWQYRFLDLDSALLFNGQSYALIEEPVYGKKHAALDYQYGTLYRYKGHYAKSESHFRKHLAYYTEKEDTIQQAKAYYAIAYVLEYKGNFDEALEACFKSKELFALKNSKLGELRTLNLIGNNLKAIGRIEDAISYYDNGISIAQEIENEEEASHLMSNRADAFFDNGDFLTALKGFRAVQEIDRKLDMTYGIGIQHQNIGIVFLALGRHAEAEKEFINSIRIKKELGHLNEVASTKAYLGLALVQNGKTNAGLDSIRKSIRECQKNDWTNGLQDAKELLAEAYFHSGQYKKASVAYKEFNELKDSITQTNLNTEMLKLQTQYETAEKEHALVKAKADNQLQQLQLDVSQKRAVAFGLAALLFALFGLILFSFYRRIKNQDSEKTILLKEIHHRVKNNLQVISSLLSIQSRSVSDEKAKAAILEGKSRVHSMALIHQNLYQKDNLTGIQMDGYLTKLSKDLIANYQVSGANIQLTTDIAPIKLDVETVVPIGLIVNELISNALKHAFLPGRNGAIEVTLKEENNSLILSVNDNGVGLNTNDLENNPGSFGHSLIRAFESKLKAKMEVLSDQGAQIIMTIQNYKKLN